jgi:hypothetical protein
VSYRAVACDYLSKICLVLSKRTDRDVIFSLIAAAKVSQYKEGTIGSRRLVIIADSERGLGPSSVRLHHLHLYYTIRSRRQLSHQPCTNLLVDLGQRSSDFTCRNLSCHSRLHNELSRLG